MANVKMESAHRKSGDAGFSLVELLFVVAFALVMGALAIPSILSTMASYQLDGAADTVSGAIRGARYQALMNGYPFQVDINSTTNQYTLSSEAPPATSFTAVGNSVMISTKPITIGVGTPSSSSAGHLTLQFKPNGSILITSGQAGPTVSFTIAYNGTTKHFTVSNYGSISVASTQP